MKITSVLVTIHLLCATVDAVAVANPADAITYPRYSISPRPQDLWKRKGGGGGRGGGGGSSGSSSGGKSSSSTGSSSSSSSFRGGSSTGSRSSGTSSMSNRGGATKLGSGPPPAYGKGAFYGGGSKTPYAAGSRSPSGIAPYALAGGIGALAFWPGLWYHPVYFYPYHHHHSYYNRSSGLNETKPILCGCQQYAVCGCDDNNNSTFLADIIGNGSYAALNKTLVNVGIVNGTNTILLNGTLPNGTTVADGQDDDDETSDALSLALRGAGYWPVVATVMAAVFLI